VRPQRRPWQHAATRPPQIEKYEYEIEELAATGGKKKSKPPPRIEFLQSVIAVHKKHIIKLEAALRCLDNDALEAEDLDPIRDSLEYYLVRRPGGRTGRAWVVAALAVPPRQGSINHKAAYQRSCVAQQRMPRTRLVRSPQLAPALPPPPLCPPPSPERGGL
jgi:hypothetical protein